MLEEKNPRSIIAIKTDEDDHFLYFIIALEPGIRGFHNSICSVIVLDGTFFKEKFKGTLIVSAA